ncbi:MAG: phage tail sheath C-terminal domain-containing protein [Bacteroidota bacterium]
MASTLNLKTPGVYIQEISKFPPSIAAVETAIPAFIGFTQKARKDGEDIFFQPLRISSLLEYEKFFGKAQPEQSLVVTIDQETDLDGNITDEVYTAKFNEQGDNGPSLHTMYYNLQLYFANGGGPCYIISCGLFLENFRQEIPGGPLTQGLDALRKEDEPTLIVVPEAQGMNQSEQFALYNAALQQCVDLQDRFAIMDLQDELKTQDIDGDVLDAVGVFRDGVRSEIGFVKYGAAYAPNVCSVFNYEYDESTIVIEHNVNSQAGTGEFNGQGLSGLNGADKSKAVTALQALSIFLAPSSAVAGVYARVDETRGVWKAPANENVVSIDKTTYQITNELQESLNVDVNSGKSVNAIRFFSGKGILVWGARTLAGNDNEWRYVSVRRFFNMVEESTKKATAQFVFEPNDANTWIKVKSMIENFLVLQWRAGALAGPTPESAFFVKVGLNETMTALDILEGRMIVEIGMAVVRPAEFIILQFSHKMQEA